MSTRRRLPLARRASPLDHSADLRQPKERKYHYIWNDRQDQHFFFDVEDDPLAQNNLYPSGLPEESRL